jgi:hypothetical protein
VIPFHRLLLVVSFSVCLGCTSLEFDHGPPLLCLTRDKEKTYAVVEKFTARKQELLLPVVHHLSQANMTAMLESNQLDVTNEDHIVMDAIYNDVFAGARTLNIRLYLLLHRAAVFRAEAVQMVDPVWLPRTCILSEENVYLCQEGHDGTPLIETAGSARVSASSSSSEVCMPLSSGMLNVNGAMLLRAWQAPRPADVLPSTTAFCGSTFRVVSSESLVDLCKLVESGDPEALVLVFGRRQAFQKDVTDQRQWSIRGARTGVAKLKSELMRLRGTELVLVKARPSTLP